MRKRSALFSFFAIFSLISLILFFLFRGSMTQPGGVLAQLFSPLRRMVYGVGLTVPENDELARLKEENRKLRQTIVDANGLKREVAALRDQFQTTSQQSSSLLPSHVIGTKGFLSGLSDPEEFTLDKGTRDGVKIGSAVVYKENVIGIIAKTSTTLSLVQLLSNKKTSLTAQTSQTNAQGILKGEGSGKMLFTNVVLSEKLSIGDHILTKGDVSLSGVGIPPGLTIGKIVSVDKKPSSLFQSAQVESIVDMRYIDIVFILMH